MCCFFDLSTIGSQCCHSDPIPLRSCSLTHTSHHTHHTDVRLTLILAMVASQELTLNQTTDIVRAVIPARNCAVINVDLSAVFDPSSRFSCSSASFHSYVPSASRLWNSLPHSTNALSTLHYFKKTNQTYCGLTFYFFLFFLFKFSVSFHTCSSAQLFAISLFSLIILLSLLFYS